MTEENSNKLIKQTTTTTTKMCQTLNLKIKLLKYSTLNFYTKKRKMIEGTCK